jgi:hypothetical protein
MKLIKLTILCILALSCISQPYLILEIKDEAKLNNKIAGTICQILTGNRDVGASEKIKDRYVCKNPAKGDEITNYCQSLGSKENKEYYLLYVPSHDPDSDSYKGLNFYSIYIWVWDRHRLMRAFDYDYFHYFPKCISKTIANDKLTEAQKENKIKELQFFEENIQTIEDVISTKQKGKKVRRRFY